MNKGRIGEHSKRKMEKKIEELIYGETDKRLIEMSAPDYRFPEKADKWDLVGILAVSGISLILIILCMVGVIV